MQDPIAHSTISPFTSTKDLIARAKFLPFTTFLLHSPSSVPFSSNIYRKYLNSDTCSSCSPSNKTSHRGLSSLTTITLLLSTFTFKPLLLHTLPNPSINPLSIICQIKDRFTFSGHLIVATLFLPEMFPQYDSISVSYTH